MCWRKSEITRLIKLRLEISAGTRRRSADIPEVKNLYRDAGQAIGQTLDLVVPEEERANHWRNFRRVMANGLLNYRPDHVLDVEGLRRDGTRVRLDVALIAIPDEAGRLVGITAIMREADRNPIT